MSFTRLLAAGRSIMGIKREPSPYRMNQEHLLPNFTPKMPTPGITVPPAAQAESTVSGLPTVNTAAGAPTTPERINRRLATRPAVTLTRKVISLLSLRRRSTPVRPVQAATPREIQTELSLDAIKVVRNDLSDSDFEGKSAQSSGPTQPLGMVWNRLSARLLRQAAQEFNVVQKERGKLLSQTGPGSGGPRSS